MGLYLTKCKLIWKNIKKEVIFVAKGHKEKIENYMKKHIVYNASIHAIGGLGLGILLASPLFGPHPVRWGVAFLVVSLLGHWYAWQQK